ncbi:hypothetical protein L7F22_054744 [Adiantum nelumboides]|nr:hypothetical protein [Adiantum nelumboides]
MKKQKMRMLSGDKGDDLFEHELMEADAPIEHIKAQNKNKGIEDKDEGNKAMEAQEIKKGYYPFGVNTTFSIDVMKCFPAPANYVYRKLNPDWVKILTCDFIEDTKQEEMLAILMPAHLDSKKPLPKLSKEEIHKVDYWIIFSHGQANTENRFLESLTRTAVMDAHAALGGVQLRICNFFTNTRPDTGQKGQEEDGGCTLQLKENEIMHTEDMEFHGGTSKDRIDEFEKGAEKDASEIIIPLYTEDMEFHGGTSKDKMDEFETIIPLDKDEVLEGPNQNESHLLTSILESLAEKLIAIFPKSFKISWLQSQNCIFLGYGSPDEMEFQLWDPKARKILCSNDVYFNEEKMHKRLTTTSEIRRVMFQEDGVVQGRNVAPNAGQHQNAPYVQENREEQQVPPAPPVL